MKSYCRNEKACVKWVEKYFKDCLCNLKDELSFGFGLVSLVCWGLAEIPQIITNFRTKSSHGVSISFLLTWVAGDIFNMVGCLLEQSTLPTQYYTALLYTISTVVLVLQSLYYDSISRKDRCVDSSGAHEGVEEEKVGFKSKSCDLGIPIPPRPIKASTLGRRDFYYTSARSLAGSNTPPFRSYLNASAKSGPSALGLDEGSSSEDETALFSSTKNTGTSQPRPISLPPTAGFGASLAVTASLLPLQSKAFSDAFGGFTGRRLSSYEPGLEHSLCGQLLGWLMACIYMGGRIPQIFLNIKRGSVEGLNPLMFAFALVANVTYVGSIVVRSVEWETISANLPWLLDAVVCVLLDLFIIMQYAYYKHVRKRTTSGKEEETAAAATDNKGDYYYVDANKNAIP